jgi:hypothetical protein
VADDESRRIELRNGGTTECAHRGALLIAGETVQLVGSSQAVLASVEAAIAPSVESVGLYIVAMGRHAGALMRAGDLKSHDWDCARLSVNGEYRRYVLGSHKQIDLQRH